MKHILRALATLLITSFTAAAVEASDVAYVSAAGNLTRVVLDTGDATLLGPMGFPVEPIAFDRGGQLFGIDNDNGTLLQLDLETGVATVIWMLDTSTLPANAEPFRDLTFDGDGRLLALRGSADLDIIDVTSGHVVPLASLSTPLASIAQIGGILFGRSFDRAYSLDPATGLATSVATCDLAGGPATAPGDIDSAWRYPIFRFQGAGVYRSDSIDLRVNGCAGSLDFSFGPHFDGVAILRAGAGTAIPSLATFGRALLVFLLAIVGLMAMRR